MARLQKKSLFFLAGKPNKPLDFKEGFKMISSALKGGAGDPRHITESLEAIARAMILGIRQAVLENKAGGPPLSQDTVIRKALELDRGFKSPLNEEAALDYTDRKFYETGEMMEAFEFTITKGAFAGVTVLLSDKVFPFRDTGGKKISYAEIAAALESGFVIMIPDPDTWGRMIGYLIQVGLIPEQGPLTPRRPKSKDIYPKFIHVPPRELISQEVEEYAREVMLDELEEILEVGAKIFIKAASIEWSRRARLTADGEFFRFLEIKKGGLRFGRRR